MNSRQRRGVILLLVSVLCAAGAFAGVLSVIHDADSKVGPEVTAYRVKNDIKPNTALQPGQFSRTTMPKRWLSRNAVTDLSAIRGKVAVAALRSGSLLQTDMIAERPALRPGEQEIAIMIDASTGVAGKIQRGSSVNIFATFAAAKQGETPQSKIIVSGARVLDVGTLTPLDPGRDDRNKTTEAVPITFALGTLDAQRVAYAESFAQHVRLALVAPGGDSTVPPGDRTYRLEKDQ
ncbi:Flp pilus assembly protein CpaB [Streptomyces sp. NPDC051597]|uniref:Flp pilus assembly protein CpaB n=1 Tax=Streptomyces sp. NPDC051597 TaxID=3155049 RepID=UPI00343BA3A0